LDLYKIPCLWVNKFIYVFSYSFHYIYVGVTSSALFPHPFGSTFKGSTFIGNFIQTLGCLIALSMNVSWGFIIAMDNILYLASCSSVLGILGMVCCNFSRVWNCFASLANGSSPSITFLSSFCYMVYSFMQTSSYYSIYVCHHFITHLRGIFFATYLNPYNNCLLIFNSSPILNL
jgi:hypothetical protein